ncbi:MAG: hypothetical protein LQ350_008552 [Teloschistes chrysophthalmus]|nr:MAG: hypothetical protein LQ350_008552 [Niorma chrysophthalma]
MCRIALILLPCGHHIFDRLLHPCPAHLCRTHHECCRGASHTSIGLITPHTEPPTCISCSDRTTNAHILSYQRARRAYLENASALQQYFVQRYGCMNGEDMRAFERRMEKWQEGHLRELWERQYARRPLGGRRRRGEDGGSLVRCWEDRAEWRLHEDLMVEHQERCVRAYWAQFYYNSSDEEAEEPFEGGAGDRVEAVNGGAGDRVEASNAPNESENADRHVETPAVGGGYTANAAVDAPPSAQADDSDAGNDSDDEAEDRFSEDEESDSDDSASHYEIEVHTPGQQQNNRFLFDGTSRSSNEGESSSDYENSDDDNTVQGTLYMPRNPPRRRLPHAAPPNHANNNNNASDSTDSETASIYRRFAHAQTNTMLRNHMRQRNEMREQRREERLERRAARWERIMNRSEERARRLRRRSHNTALRSRYLEDFHSDPSSPGGIVQANDQDLEQEDFDPSSWGFVQANDQDLEEQENIDPLSSGIVQANANDLEQENIDITTFLTSRTYRPNGTNSARVLADTGSVEDVVPSSSVQLHIPWISNPPGTMQTGEESVSGEPSIPPTSNANASSGQQTGEESLATTTNTSAPTDAGPQTAEEIANDGNRGAAERRDSSSEE